VRGLFVTGTDTGVGKTVVSAVLLAKFPRARYWKPIQTGIESDDDTAEVLRLSGRGPSGARAEGIRLRHPVSPHLAARRAGVRIDLDQLTEWTAAEDGAWIVEGAGGVLAPVNESQTVADLMKRLKLPVAVVARTTLGTLNHTLLTLEALRARSLAVAGVLMCGDPNPDNRATIECQGRVRVAEVPRFDPLTQASFATWTAPAWLEEYLA
jgi:dethiobiotin synthase